MTAAPLSILVVDDETELRGLISEFLKRRGFVVFQAENITQAASLLESGQIQLVVSDIRMPGGDGTQLLKSIQASPKPVPVILISGYSDVSADEAVRLGAFAYLQKPFGFKNLLETVQSAVSKIA